MATLQEARAGGKDYGCCCLTCQLVLLVAPLVGELLEWLLAAELVAETALAPAVGIPDQW